MATDQWGGDTNPEEGANIFFCKNFAENCIKMITIGPRGGEHPLRPLDPQMVNLVMGTENMDGHDISLIKYKCS